MSSSVRYKVVGIGYRYSIFNSTWPLSLTLLKLMVVNNLLLDHVGPPPGCYVAVHLVIFLLDG